MALVTRPVMSLARPIAGTAVEKSSVIFEEKTVSAYSYHKPLLAMLIDISEKGDLAGQSYSDRIEKMAKLVTSEKESRMFFQTLCAMSFLDRYQKRPVVVDVFDELDRKISNPQLTMFKQLEKECFQLLTRMGTIENLRSLDTDLVCLLCTHSYRNLENTSLNNLLLEIGRSVWPYVNRPLWESEPFVDFISDILEVVGGRLESLYPKNFKIAWNVIRQSIIGVNTTLSNYSTLRLLSVIEHHQNMWSLPEKTKEYYKEQYKQFLEARMKELSSFHGCLPSRRKTSLTVKPGRSAADFLKRRLSSNNQEKDMKEQTESCSSSSSLDGSDTLSDVFEEVFEVDDIRTNGTSGVKNESCAVSPDNHSCFKQCSSSTDQPVLRKETQDEILTNAVAAEECSSKGTGEELSSSEEWLFKDGSQGKSFAAEEHLLEDARQDDATSSEAISIDPDHRSLNFEKKKIIVKVPRKYVGRVIGAHGAVIKYIQDISGAKVNFIKAPSRPSYSMSSFKNIVHNSLGIPKTNSSTDIDSNSEEGKKTEVTEQQEGTEIVKEEEEFEIIGTDDTIWKAKRKIEYIVKTAQDMESRPTLIRSYSEVTPVQGFKQIYRSLSCPITDWGESCAGVCVSCQKRCYCRAFLLSRSESPTAWIRPVDLAINRDADWTEFIIKTQVKDFFQRPSQDTTKTSSKVNHFSGSQHEADMNEV